VGSQDTAQHGAQRASVGDDEHLPLGVFGQDAGRRARHALAHGLIVRVKGRRRVWGQGGGALGVLVMRLGFAQVVLKGDVQLEMGVDDGGGLAGAAQGAAVTGRKGIGLFGRGQPVSESRGLRAAQVGQVGVGAERAVEVAVRLPVAGENEFEHFYLPT